MCLHTTNMAFYKTWIFLLFIAISSCHRVIKLDKPSETSSTTHSIQHRVQPLNSTSEVSAAIKLKEKIEIKLYYETLCPASVDFFVRQLKPVVARLASYLDVHLIPYGHATIRTHLGHYVFNCQHGIAECYGNTVQACAVDVIQNNTKAVFFNSCLLEHTSYQTDYDYFVSTFNWCGYREGVHLPEIWKCVNSRRGMNLLKAYGEETSQIKLPYVPYVVIDGLTSYQDEAATDLFGIVCQLLTPKPLACYKHHPHALKRECCQL